MKLFFEEKWNLKVSVSIIYRVLKQERLSRKKSYCDGSQSSQLRIAWQANMLNYTIEQLVFFDESLFKTATGWRYIAYKSIAEEVRWQDDIRRDNIYSVLSVYIVDGYLLCTSIKKNYYNNEELYQ